MYSAFLLGCRPARRPGRGERADYVGARFPLARPGTAGHA